MKTKEQWIGETMDSLDGMQRATSDPMLHEKVTTRLGQSVRSSRPGQSDQSAIFPAVNLLLKIAAGLALLISVNVISVVVYSRAVAAENNLNPVAAGYFSYIKTVTPEL